MSLCLDGLNYLGRHAGVSEAEQKLGKSTDGDTGLPEQRLRLQRGLSASTVRSVLLRGTCVADEEGTGWRCEAGDTVTTQWGNRLRVSAGMRNTICLGHPNREGRISVSM